MPAIDNLLKRFGFVKLARYGLVLTPEGRIMSLRPAVLEDGLGGRIVGWADGDLAAMELQKWEPARPASPQAVATRLAVTPPPRPMPKPAVVVAPIAPIAPAPKPVTVVAAPAVAQAPQVDEDDWEWTIALARARVAAEESEQAAASVRTRARLDTIPPPAAKLAVLKIPPLEQTMPDWPKTEPITSIEYEDRSRDQVSRITSRPAPPTPIVERPLATPVGVRKPAPTQPLAAVAAPAKQARPGTTPPTVIPIPKLPSIKNRTTQIQPVISSSATRPSRTRLAKGTGPVSGTHVGPPPPPPIRPGEDLDKTSPGMPAIAAAVTLPSIKRLAR